MTTRVRVRACELWSLLALVAGAGVPARAQAPSEFRIEVFADGDDWEANPRSYIVGRSTFTLRITALDSNGEPMTGFASAGVPISGIESPPRALIDLAHELLSRAKEDRASRQMEIPEGLTDSQKKACEEARAVLEKADEAKSREALRQAARILRREAREMSSLAAAPFADGQCVLRGVRLAVANEWSFASFGQDGLISVGDGSARTESESKEVWYVPGWMSLAPSLLAILLAILFRKVLLALLAGIWIGATIAFGLGDAPTSWMVGFMRMLDRYFVRAVADASHAQILMFSLALGGMVAIIARSGGMQGVVNLFSKLARGPRSGQLATWFLGIFIFFDDYANALLIGNTMRPLTDRLKISREKLSYIVDSTSAPVASVALISTWIGFEVGLIDEALKAADSSVAWASGYVWFVDSIPYRFYAIYAFFLVFVIAVLRRDFGPMLKAERRAALEGKPIRDGAQPLADKELLELAPPAGKKPRAMNAIVPILVVIAGTLAGLFYSGVKNIEGLSGDARDRVELALDGRQTDSEGDLSGERLYSDAEIGELTNWESPSEPRPGHTFHERLGTAWRFLTGDAESESWRRRGVLAREIFATADSYATLMWTAFAGCLVAGLMAWGLRVLSLNEVVDSWVAGVKSMILAALILILAWSIGDVTKELSAAQFVSRYTQDVPGWTIPAIGFVACALVSFATGSSWATMTVMFPLLVPVAYINADGAHHVLLGTIGAVLAGSIFGDHCSPISDTTVMSSMSSACDHTDHVRTQMPYALVGGLVAIGAALAAGNLESPTAVWGLLGAGGVVLVAIVMILGKNPEAGANRDLEATLTMASPPRRR